MEPGALFCSGWAGALRLMDKLPGGPQPPWTRGRDTKASQTAPSSQPCGLTFPGAGGHNQASSFLAWESPLGGWGRDECSSSSLEWGPGRRARWKQRCTGLQTQTGTQTRRRCTSVPAFCVRVLHFSRHDTVRDAGFPEACAATTTRSLMHGALRVPKPWKIVFSGWTLVPGTHKQHVL